MPADLAHALTIPLFRCGHKRTVENTMVRPDRLRCRQCHNEWSRQSDKRKWDKLRADAAREKGEGV